jgi:hypothetical protein
VKSRKIIILSGLSLVALVVAINFFGPKYDDYLLTQRLQEVLERNNLTLESASCHIARGVATGFCSFKATPSQIKSLVARFKLRSVSINAEGGAFYNERDLRDFPLNTYLHEFCLEKLNSPISKIDAHSYFRSHPEDRLESYFARFQLYYIKSTGAGCLGLQYPLG